MLIKKLIKFIEDWAPPGIAWERDNVGLQIGSREDKIKNVLLSLDLTEDVVDKAIRNNCNFIFNHHPFFFFPVKSIDYSKDSKSRLIKKLITNNISVYSAHTNLDFTKEGVNFQLAKKLGLKNIKFLVPLEKEQLKVVVFVPESALPKLSEAVFEAGAGVIGEYSDCGFFSKGKGTFKGSENSNPVVGKKNVLTETEEIRFEIIADSWNLGKVISAIIKSHPYEEPAYDVYPLKNHNGNFGSGAIGELEKSLTKNEFLTLVAVKLKTDALRYASSKTKRIKKVAVCGGTCSNLLDNAIAQGADAFITADVTYHTFQQGENKILFIDAGHYETENIVLNEVQKRFERFFSENGEKIKVMKYKGNTNPVKFFINNKRKK
jgi:dinuclear metal center YbgI/SA1388 family protein